MKDKIEIKNHPFLIKLRADLKVKKVLLKIGISSNNKGFFYILEGYNILNKRQIHINMITLYEMIGNKFGENRSTVERLTRYSINKAYEKSEILKKIYEKKPNNSQFLYDLVFNFEIFEEMALNGGK